MSDQAEYRSARHHKRHISKQKSKKMMRDGQKTLSREIEDTTRCCEDYDCQYPTWPLDQCRRCEKACNDRCYHFLGAYNARMRENRWFMGKYALRRLSKDERLPVSTARYLLLEDCPLGKTGTYVELEIKKCWSKKA